MVTPIYPCCKGGLRMRSKIPFELHEMLYIGKDLCALTNTRLLKEDDKDKRVFEDRKKLNAL